MMWAKEGCIMRDKMADIKVIVWSKEGGIMRDKMADKKVIVWSKEGGIMRDNGTKEGHSLDKSSGHIKGQD